MSEIELLRKINAIDKRLSRTETWDGGGSAGASKQYATFVIAASDTTADGKAAADYVCDGTDDQDEINTAIALATTSTYRRILLLEGTFSITQQIVMAANMMLEGQGNATVLSIDGRPSTNIILYVNAKDNVRVRNMKIDGQAQICNFIFRINASSNISFDNIWFDSIYCVRCISAIGTCSDLRFSNNKFTEFTGSGDAIVVWAIGGTNTITSILINENMFDLGTVSTGNAIEIDGDDNADGDLPAIGSMYARDIVISDNIHNGSGSVGVYGSFALLTSAENITITGNVINKTVYGIYCDDCFMVTITGNHLWWMDVNGILFDTSYLSTDNGGPRYFTISSNVISFTPGDGIGIVGPNADAAAPWRTNEDFRTYSAVIGNIIHDCDTGITVQAGSTLTISGNTIVDSADMGIYADDAWEMIIDGNTFNLCEYGIVFGEVYDTVISNNLIHESMISGVRLLDTTDTLISGNYFIENGTDAVNGDSDIQIISQFSSVNDKVVIDGNMFRSGYVTTYGSACINIADTAASGVVIRDNDSRTGYATFVSNSSSNIVREYGNILTSGVQTNRYTRGEYARTVNAGAIVMSDTSDLMCRVAPETGVTDDLDTITATSANDRQTIVIRTDAVGNTITLKDGTGNLMLSADFAMDHISDMIQLYYDHSITVWIEQSRSDNF